MKQLLIILICTVVSQCAFGQDKDSTKRKIEIDNKSVNIYASAGYQKKFYYEIGIGHGRFQGGYGNLAHLGYFVTYEHTVGTPNFDHVHGVKIGGFFAGLGGGFTTEIKYLWNEENKDLVITPKFGIGLGGIIQVNYGYNISLQKSPFEQIGKHQFALIFNLPVWVYKGK